MAVRPRPRRERESLHGNWVTAFSVTEARKTERKKKEITKVTWE